MEQLLSQAQSLSRKIGQRCLEKSQSIGTAESCTGGWLSVLLTDIPGSSDYVRGAVVAYSNALKQSLLHVPLSLIRDCGAVSEEVVVAMAAGGRQTLGADWVLATSGVAGPGGGSVEKPVGTVCYAIVGPGVSVQGTLSLLGDRSQIRLKSCIEIFQIVINLLK